MNHRTSYYQELCLPCAYSLCIYEMEQSCKMQVLAQDDAGTLVTGTLEITVG